LARHDQSQSIDRTSVQFEIATALVDHINTMMATNF
jgi:hypothetical protein